MHSLRCEASCCHQGACRGCCPGLGSLWVPTQDHPTAREDSSIQPDGSPWTLSTQGLFLTCLVPVLPMMGHRGATPSPVPAIPTPSKLRWDRRRQPDPSAAWGVPGTTSLHGSGVPMTRPLYGPWIQQGEGKPTLEPRKTVHRARNIHENQGVPEHRTKHPQRRA